MTTITYTALALGRKDGGVVQTAMPTNISGAVIPDVLRSKSTNTLSSQSAPLGVTSPAVVKYHPARLGNGSNKVFAIASASVPVASRTVYADGVAVDGTWAGLTFTATDAPANGANVVVCETITYANVTDAKLGGTIATAPGTRTNY